MADASAINGYGFTGLSLARPFPTTGYAPVERTLDALSPIEDQVDFSDAARRLGDSAAAERNLRADRIASVRAAILDGSYETDEKLDAAIDALINDLG